MVYIHIPFCRSFCTYCGFYSELPHGCEFNLFTEALCAEICSRRDEITSEKNTLYIGGGTPSVLPLSCLEKIVRTLGGGTYEEFTVEVNPDDISLDYAVALRDMGVNRVSMGVQSFDDALLKMMNRRHDSEGALKAFADLRRAGFENISIDLIFGMVSSGWEESLRQAIALRPEHISAYQLSIEQDSALEKMLQEGKFSELAQEECEGQYSLLCRMLSEAGYHHYEVSNFALPGFRAKHNSAYWTHVPYVGFGPGAHSLSTSGGIFRRSWNEPDLAAYLRGNCPRGEEVLTPEQISTERIMLGLRTAEGAALEASPARERLLGEGLLEPCGERFRIPEKKFFISDSIIRELV